MQSPPTPAPTITTFLPLSGFGGVEVGVADEPDDGGATSTFATFAADFDDDDDA